MPINRYEDEGIARYWNSKYDDDYHPYCMADKKVLELISDLKLPNGSTCLELGIGGGQMFLSMLRWLTCSWCL